MRLIAAHPFIPAVVLALAVLVAPAAQGGVTSVVIDGDQAVAEISVAGVQATLTLTFEDAVGLTEQNLGLSALEIDPLDPALLARLPGLNSLPAGFPVLIRIEPPLGGGLSFHGLAQIEVYTHALNYTPGCPFRLFSAPLGGSFRDITESMGAGSYRVRGGKGDFSEFLIVVEGRLVDTVIDGKFVRLSDLLVTYDAQIEPTVANSLDDLLSNARKSYDEGRLVPAIKHVEAFLNKVENKSGDDIPDVWRSARDLDNVAGLLRSAGETLHFSLTWKNSGL